jgi:hypothetical protein
MEAGRLVDFFIPSGRVGVEVYGEKLQQFSSKIISL